MTTNIFERLAQQAVRDARTAYAHARQRCLIGLAKQSEVEAAETALEAAKAELASIRESLR